MPLNIIFKNDRLLVVDKPAGFSIEEVANKAKSQFPELEKLGEERRYGVVHRLDKDTSGILLLAKTALALKELQQQFQERQVEKRYVCLAEGSIQQENGVIHNLLGRSPADRRKQKNWNLKEPGLGKREAISEWKVLTRFAYYTLCEVAPKTGRKHQIRAHMVSLGHPIAGDKLYGFKDQKTPENLTRQFLHARYLKIDGQEFISELPQDLRTVLEKLQKKHDN
jgi:23S rRNA pseudouridine1911/1915/1917 synthase